MSDRTRVILVEDDELLRSSLASYLTLAGFEVSEAADGLSFYRVFADVGGDVAVIDLGLPDQSGTTLVEYVRKNSSVPIIVITARDTLDTRVDCYQTGADLFLGKPVEGRELAAAIASLASRRHIDGPPAAASSEPGWTLLATQRVLVSPAGTSIDCTGLECQFLLALAEAAPRSASRAAILEAIYQRADASAEHALETLARRTRQKIADAVGGAAPILTEYGVGYRFSARVSIRHD